ncbi:hypothetical protein D187_008810 [Cystobacter fuscus DSM 2262]|uniref:Uncharacterized protein n=1 Tax=Cystobacter fuscus (strain ATCC 25194 / DSM 2262 / NBRC 100088 / M29) TaxID=1242864 RepID=S9PJP5_CYSF2|nr:hypothetical protein [Cystobacter fuscus]EPX62622.1 hypothetical protein D187_008810 [Cystobacter fuscus DSM 2262]
MMTRETARKLSELMVDVGRRLDESLHEVQGRESEEFFKKYRRTVGDLMGTMLMEVMNPIYAHYPDLTPPQLRQPGFTPDKARSFKATHRLHLPGGEAPVEVMLYESGGGLAHTEAQWRAFQMGECIQKPFWHCFRGRWSRDNDALENISVVVPRTTPPGITPGGVGEPPGVNTPDEGGHSPSWSSLLEAASVHVVSQGT